MTETWEYGGPGTGPEHADGPGAHGGEEPPGRFTWPPPEDAPVLAAFGETWKNATFNPGAFFAKTPRDGGTGAALIYYLAIGILVGGATLFWQSLSLMGDAMGENPLAAELGIQPVNPLAGFLLTPALLLLGLLIGCGIIHVLLLIFDGADHGFGTTIRVYCYAGSASIFGVVPVLGAIVGGVWTLVLLIIGLREAHQAAAWKSAVAVLLPLVLALGLLLTVFLTFVLAMGGAMTGG